MYDFIYKKWFYLRNFVCWECRKIPETKEKTNKTKKKSPLWWFSHPHFYDMEADCFPVSENAENKPEIP